MRLAKRKTALLALTLAALASAASASLTDVDGKPLRAARVEPARIESSHFTLSLEQSVALDLVLPELAPASLEDRLRLDVWGPKPHVRAFDLGLEKQPQGPQRFELEIASGEWETGLYYAQARFYDPEIGRFLNEDPFGGALDLPPSLHRYLYAYQNPTVFWDPSGRTNALVAAINWLKGTAEEAMSSIDEGSSTAEVVKTATAAGLLNAAADFTAGFNWVVNAVAVTTPGVGSTKVGQEANAEIEQAAEAVRAAAARGVERLVEDPDGSLKLVAEVPPALIPEGLESVLRAASGDKAEQAEILSSAVRLGTNLIPVGGAGWTRKMEHATDALEDFSARSWDLGPTPHVGENVPSRPVPSSLPQTRAAVWNEDPTRRGTLIEDILATTEYRDWYRVCAEDGGRFPLVDFQQLGTLVSLKSVDTSGASWYRRMQEHIDDMATRGAMVDDRPANMVLDLRVQPGGAADPVPLIAYGRQRGVTVVIREFR